MTTLCLRHEYRVRVPRPVLQELSTIHCESRGPYAHRREITVLANSYDASSANVLRILTL